MSTTSRSCSGSTVSSNGIKVVKLAWRASDSPRVAADINKDCNLARGSNFYVYNAEAELDAPGEYYINRQDLRLTFIPPRAARPTENRPGRVSAAGSEGQQRCTQLKKGTCLRGERAIRIIPHSTNATKCCDVRIISASIVTLLSSSSGESKNSFFSSSMKKDFRAPNQILPLAYEPNLLDRYHTLEIGFDFGS